MPTLETFISSDYRPIINGGRLDRSHEPKHILSRVNLDDLEKIIVNSITFGPKQDKVLLNLEHAIQSEDNILILYYEDIHKKWTFVKNSKESFFILRQNFEKQFRIETKILYIRGCQIETDDIYWRILGEFYNFIDCWPGKVICAPRNQCINESKLYQLNSSLKKGIGNGSLVSIGKSYVIKGENSFQNLPKNTSFVVKSLSGIRSIVVDEKEFLSWEEKNISNLPVLFQEKVKGQDLRVHVINYNSYGKISTSKSTVDYRYDKQFHSSLKSISIGNELKEFCIKVARYENNILMGIDFIKTNSGYVVLEANPSPGWSAYHECNGIDTDNFIEDLILELKNE